MKTVIKRKNPANLTDEEKYKALDMYSEGKPMEDIATALGVDRKRLSTFIQTKLKEMLLVRETNDLQKISTKNPKVASAISTCLNPAFLSQVDEVAEAYAYYFIETGDNEFALKQCGLDIGIPKGTKKPIRSNILKIRGQYIRDIPAVKKYIKDAQDKRMTDLNVDRLYIQRSLVEQIEQQKILAQEDPRVRGGISKNIELLGKTIGAFQENISIDGADAKTGLDVLMQKIQDKEGTTTYERAEEEEAGIH